jgi:hypothetical protein
MYSYIVKLIGQSCFKFKCLIFHREIIKIILPLQQSGFNATDEIKKKAVKIEWNLEVETLDNS